MPDMLQLPPVIASISHQPNLVWNAPNYCVPNLTHELLTKLPEPSSKGPNRPHQHRDPT